MSRQVRNEKQEGRDYRKPGPSTFERCSSQKEEMKEKKADVSRKTDDTIFKTTPSSHQVKDDEMKENIIISFQNIFNNIKMSDIHNYYICSERNCTEICKEDRANMSKDNKSQHKWLFVPKIAFCDRSHKWCLTYTDGKGMFCALCRICNTKQSNDLKVWNSTANVRCRTETIRQHFQSKSSIHTQAVEMDSQKKKSYFVKETQKQEELKDTVYEKVFQALYWLAKEEIANTKITSLLQLLEKAGVSEIKYFQTRSEPVLREMLINLSSTIVEGLTKRIKNSKCFGLLTDEVTDISNVQQLVTFIKFFDMEKGDTSTVFVDSSDLLEQSEEGFPNANAILNCLVKMLDRLGFDLSHLKAF